MNISKEICVTGLMGLSAILNATPGRVALAQQQGLGSNRHTQNSNGDVIDANTDQFSDEVPPPWFNHPVIREALQLNEEAFSQLYRSYQLNWQIANQNLHDLGENLAPEQQEQQLDQISGAFQMRFDQGIRSILIDPTDRQRFYQIYTQYRTYGAFNDPIVQQQLNLTGEQINVFQIWDREWNLDLDDWAAQYAIAPRAVTARVYQSRIDFFSRVYVVLTAEQIQIWQKMTGDPFDFPPDVFLADRTTAFAEPGKLPEADLTDL